MVDSWVVPARGRIVSLLPSATEIVYALGLAERLVGVTHECDFPPEAREKPRLTASTIPHAADASEVDRHVRESLHAGSSLYSLDRTLLEIIAPDLIITQELCTVCAVSYEIVDAAAKSLRGDPRVISLEPASLEDVYSNVATIGALTATQAEATRFVTSLRERAERLRVAVSGKSRPRTLVLEWTDPPYNARHWTPGLVDLAGGEPLLATPGAYSQTITWDAIVASDPDVVIVAPCGFDLAATLRAIDDLATREPAWKSLRAVRERRAYAIDGNAFVNRPGPRLVDTAELFATAIHGEPIGAAAEDSAAFRRL